MLLCVYQPVATVPNGDWTDDFLVAVDWFRSRGSKSIFDGAFANLLPCLPITAPRNHQPIRDKVRLNGRFTGDRTDCVIIYSSDIDH